MQVGRDDIAFVNAGLFNGMKQLTPDGHRMLLQVSSAYDDILTGLLLTTAQVNFLSTAYLVQLLLPPLSKEIPPGRLVLVSSEDHAKASYSAPQEDDSFRKLGSKDNEYYLAKLFLILYGRKLASRLDQSKTVVVMITLGFFASSSFRDSDGSMASMGTCSISTFDEVWRPAARARGHDFRFQSTWAVLPRWMLNQVRVIVVVVNWCSIILH